METQEDRRVRMVALVNLKAMADRVSGTCHRYEVTKITRSRIHVTYSNPDEYGNEHPMTMVMPCIPSHWPEDEENPRVLLYCLRVIDDNWDGEGWQAFDVLLDCPTLWRGEDGWKSHQDLREAGLEVNANLPDTCTVCDLPKEGK